jgi:hypothetical protein
VGEKGQNLGSLQEITIAKDRSDFKLFTEYMFSSTDILNCDFTHQEVKLHDLVTTQVI